MYKAKPPLTLLIDFLRKLRENYMNLTLYLYIVISLRLGRPGGMAKQLAQCLYLLILTLLSVCGMQIPPTSIIQSLNKKLI
jgi:hypothetical protein